MAQIGGTSSCPRSGCWWGAAAMDARGVWGISVILPWMTTRHEACEGSKALRNMSACELSQCCFKLCQWRGIRSALAVSWNQQDPRSNECIASTSVNMCQHSFSLVMFASLFIDFFGFQEHVGGDPIPISSAGPVGALPLPAPWAKRLKTYSIVQHKRTIIVVATCEYKISDLCGNYIWTQDIGSIQHRLMGLMVWQERTSGLNFHNTPWTQQHQVIYIQIYTHIRYVDVATLRCGPFWYIFFIRSPYIHLAIGQQPPGLPSKH